MIPVLRRHAVAVSVALFTAAVVATPPVEAHITKKIKHSWKHVRRLADARYQLKGTSAGNVECSGCVSETDLSFNPATQGELDGFKGQLATTDGDAPNAGSNLAHWDNLNGVPGGFVDGVDDTGGTASDLTCNACVQESELTFDPATQSEMNAHNHDASYWKLTGNALTATDFLGSTNAQALDVRVNNVRALRLEPNGTDAANVIGGFSGNSVSNDVRGATISGGGELGAVNRVTDDRGVVGGGIANQAGDAAGSTTDASFATVGGGKSNSARATYATVGGGEGNNATAAHATVGGGQSNTVNGPHATVGGGLSNVASANSATVGGGQLNSATSFFGTVPGGIDNTASGQQSFAAGSNTSTAGFIGSFVLGDSSGSTFNRVSSTAANQFTSRFAGGYVLYTDPAKTTGAALPAGGGSWTALSDRVVKSDVAPIDPRDVLARVASLPVTTWRYNGQAEGIRHIGPMAQDFHAAFGVGEDPRYITSVDADGVALAAIQGLNRKLEDLRAQVAGSPVGTTEDPLGGLLPGIGMLGLALGIAFVGRRTMGGVWPAS